MVVTLQIESERRLAVFGMADKNLKTLRELLKVHITARDEELKISGDPAAVEHCAAAITELIKMAHRRQNITSEHISTVIAKVANGQIPGDGPATDVSLDQQGVVPRTQGQKRYVEAMLNHDLVFCVGPAGTGKTFLAVALAVSMLRSNRARRLVLVRPAVEAGEKLGFLPGDIQAKVNPYLRPLLDALHDMMPFEQIRRFMTNDIIELAPLAYMRGRTLNEAIIILDEAQNTTPAQMLMFLTRLGEGSKMIITGDPSQVDLEAGQVSGLVDARRKLAGIHGILFVELDKSDIVRHRLVQNIVHAYEPRHQRGTSDEG